MRPDARRAAPDTQGPPSSLFAVLPRRPASCAPTFCLTCASEGFVSVEPSANRTVRPELTAALDYARPGDTLCVWKLDRFARSLIDLVTMVDTLRERGIGFKVLTGALANIDPGTADGRLMLQVVGAMAEFERSLIKERTRAGLDAAKAQGRTGGRPSVVDEDVLTVARARKAKGESVSAIAKALGISRATLYRHLGESA